MIIAMEGWLRHLKRKSKRCWLLSAFLCISCGKKVSDKNPGKKKVASGKAQIKPIKEEMILNYDSTLKLHNASHLFHQNAFYQIPKTLQLTAKSSQTALYFHVEEERYGFVCYYTLQDFKECRDEKDILIEGLESGEVIHMLEGTEFYIESHGIQKPRAIINTLLTVDP